MSRDGESLSTKDHDTIRTHWFEMFDDRGLELQYQETTKDGEQSNFNRLTDGS